MIIIDGLIFGLQENRGVTRLIKEIINHIDLPFHIIDKKKVEKNFIKKYYYYSQFFKKVNIKNFNIFHSTYYRLSNKINIVNFYDFTHEKFKSGIKNNFFTLIKKKSAIYADKIICISQNTKQDLLERYKGINENKIEVIYPIISKQFTRKKILINKNQILYVGGRETYKNFSNVVLAVKKLGNYKLKIIGGGELSFHEKQFLKNEIPNMYEHRNNINDETLNEEYNTSFCLIYSSYYEGFGMPIIEAMKTGCPVIANGGSSIDEVCGNSALLVNCGKFIKIAEAVKSLENENFRNKISKKAFLNSQKFKTSIEINKLKSLYRYFQR